MLIRQRWHQAALVVVCYLSVNLCANVSDYYKTIECKPDGHSYDIIDYVYMINLDHRPEKLQQTLDEFSPYGIVPYRFSAINGKLLSSSALQNLGVQFLPGMRGGGMGRVYRIHNGKEYPSNELVLEEGTTYFAQGMERGTIGCILSHLSILKDAYSSGYELIWILEDDAIVVENPQKLVTCIHQLDRAVGRQGWDLLFTDRDYRMTENEYILTGEPEYRPDISTASLPKGCFNKQITREVRQIGTRFGSASIIWTRAGMKKYLEYAESHGLFLPFDLDYYLAPNIKLFTTTKDIVSNRFDAISDND